MRKNTGKFVVALCAFFSAFGLSSAGAPALVGTETQVTTAAADQFDPAISGNIVVYTDFSGVDADVWYTDLSNGQAHAVTTEAGDQQLTDVSGTRIVYTNWNTMDVHVFDISTGLTVNLTNAAGSNSLDPSIGGDLVAWTDDRDGNAEIYARNLATGEERRITTSFDVDEAPSVGDGVIAWERCDGFACDILAYDWATGVTRVVANYPWAAERFADVSGRTIVFQREQGTPIDKDVAAYNLDTGMTTFLELPGDQENAHVSGDFVVFNDSASGIPHIGVWQLSTGAHFTATTAASGQYLNAIDGQRVVYSDDRAGALDIWAYDFTIDTGQPPDAEAQLVALGDLVESLNLKRGIENSLDAKLDAAMAALAAARGGDTGTACNQLAAFIHEVDAQTGKAITVTDAEALKAAANQVLAALGCS